MEHCDNAKSLVTGACNESGAFLLDLFRSVESNLEVGHAGRHAFADKHLKIRWSEPGGVETLLIARKDPQLNVESKPRVATAPGNAKKEKKSRLFTNSRLSVDFIIDLSGPGSDST